MELYKKINRQSNYYFSKDEVFVVGVVEVTIPWDGRVEAARAEKRQTYSPLVEALSGKYSKYVYMREGLFEYFELFR